MEQQECKAILRNLLFFFATGARDAEQAEEKKDRQANANPALL